MKVILISGPQGSGKSTLQTNLVNRINRDVNGTRAYALNFADVLYEMHYSVLGILKRYYPERNDRKDGPLLQVLGTEWGRKTVDDNIWIKCLTGKMESLAKMQGGLYSDNVFVVGDCRFQNEFHAFPEALRVRLVCDALIRKQRCNQWRDNTQHQSEIDLDEYSYKRMFDLYLESDTTSENGCLELVMAQLQKNTWMEKRIEK